MAFTGIKQENIADAMGLSKPTLTRHYRHELDNGLAGILTIAAQKLVSIIRDEKNVSPAAVDAAKFILARRGGWVENNVVDMTVHAVTDEPLSASEWESKFATKAIAAPIEEGVFTVVADPVPVHVE